MEIDSYQQCPCQSGKKIKFCCGKDLVSDLNSVLAKERAGQSIAAVEHLDRTIEKAGPRECLLTIQTHILISHGEIERAKQANKMLLDNHPGHVTGLQHTALIALAEGKTEDAIGKLQDAMDAIPGNELPVSLANAFRSVGIGLLNGGDLLAGRAHLEFASELKGNQDEELEQMLYSTYCFNGLPIVLKRSFKIADPPSEDVEWHKKYVNVGRALARGQFRKALKFLEKIDAKFPDQPIVVEAIAIVSGFLGMANELPEKFRRIYQLPETKPWDAIEAELVVQAVASEPPVAEQTVLRITLPLTDASEAMESATSSDRFVTIPADEKDPFGEGPAPKQCYAVLNKPAVKSPEELSIENVPSVLSEIKLFGKQTDRDARLELVVSDNHRVSDSMAVLKEVFGSLLQEKSAETVLGQASVIDRVFRVDWHLPKETSRKRFEALMEQHYPVMLGEYKQLEFNCLDGKSIVEAAKDDQYVVRVQALLVQTRTMLQERQGGLEASNRLIEELGVELPPAIDLTSEEPVTLPSPFQMQFVDLSNLPNEPLFEMHRLAMMLKIPTELLRTVNEMLDREGFDLMPRDLLLSMKAQGTRDNDEALACLVEARDEAKGAGQPVGQFLLQEFELRLERGLTEKLPRLLHTLQTNHLQEPGIEAGLTEILHRYGLIDESQLMGGKANPMDQMMPPVAAPPSPEPTPASSTAEEPSKLWLPE